MKDGEDRRENSLRPFRLRLPKRVTRCPQAPLRHPTREKERIEKRKEPEEPDKKTTEERGETVLDLYWPRIPKRCLRSHLLACQRRFSGGLQQAGTRIVREERVR